MLLCLWKFYEVVKHSTLFSLLSIFLQEKISLTKSIKFLKKNYDVLFLRSVLQRRIQEQIPVKYSNYTLSKDDDRWTA